MYRTVLTDRDTGGLGEMVLEHPPGTFAPSPASRVTLLAVGRHRHLFRGVGVDWGCGVGALAIALSRIRRDSGTSPASPGRGTDPRGGAGSRPGDLPGMGGVGEVVGLDLVPANVEAARRNAAANGAADRTRFMVSDSFVPVDPEERAYLDGLAGSLAFVVANPPASVGDDGFTFRRLVLAGARDRLRPGGFAVLQALSAYGPERVERMVRETGGFDYEGVIERSAPTALDVTDPRMMAFLETYVREEARGGLTYHFFRDETLAERLTATEAMARFRGEGALPWARWQVHLFRRI